MAARSLARSEPLLPGSCRPLRDAFERGSRGILSGLLVLLSLAAIVPCAGCSTAHGVTNRGVDFAHDVRRDYWNFYTSPRTRRVGAVALGSAAVMANTTVDEKFGAWVQRDVRSKDTDNFSAAVRDLGAGQYVLPVMVATYAATEVLPPTAEGEIINEWSNRTLRGAAVGAPVVIFGQSALGASRPGENAHHSRWSPFNDDNSVSGHAFVGALPFITAAQCTDNRLAKGAFYTAGSLAGLSRINDDSHYASQVVLGWTVAYLAAESVNDTELEQPRFELVPVPLAEGTGVGMMIKY